MSTSNDDFARASTMTTEKTPLITARISQKSTPRKSVSKTVRKTTAKPATPVPSPVVSELDMSAETQEASPVVVKTVPKTKTPAPKTATKPKTVVAPVAVPKAEEEDDFVMPPVKVPKEGTVAALLILARAKGLSIPKGTRKEGLLQMLGMTAAPAKKSKSKGPRDPLQPKRLLTSYMRFTQVKRDGVKARLARANPGAKVSVTLVAKELGVEWGLLTDEQKLAYAAPESEKQAHAEEMANYKESKIEAAGPKPKRNLSAYLYFCSAKRASVLRTHPTYKVTDVARELGVQWGLLTPTQKIPYMKQAATDKIRYEKEKAIFIQWKKDMGIVDPPKVRRPRAPKVAVAVATAPKAVTKTAAKTATTAKTAKTVAKAVERKSIDLSNMSSMENALESDVSEGEGEVVFEEK